MSTEEEVYQRLKEKREKNLTPQDCDGVKRKSRNWVIVMVIITMITFFPLLTFSLMSTSAIVDVRVNMKDMNLTPDRTIQVGQMGNTKIYANSTNATFKPTFMLVLISYPEMDQFWETEYAFQQFPNRMIDPQLNQSYEQIFAGQVDEYGVGGVIKMVNRTGETRVQLRLSADYKVYIKIGVVVSFITPFPADFQFQFLYSQGHENTDLLGKPLGKTLFELRNAYTWDLNITGFYYDYDHINSRSFPTGGAASNYNDVYDIEPYGFILNATQETKFDWNNFVGVK